MTDRPLRELTPDELLAELESRVERLTDRLADRVGRRDAEGARDSFLAGHDTRLAALVFAERKLHRRLVPSSEYSPPPPGRRRMTPEELREHRAWRAK